MRKIFYLVFLVAFISSCEEPGSMNNEDNKEKNELENEANEALEKRKKKAYYPIPSPDQMFGFINDNGLSYDNKLMNSIDKLEEINNPNSMALNFGVYTADLAYAAAYEDLEATLGLYKTVRLMSSKLDIADLMSKEMIERMESNLENKDSLAIVAGNSYYDAVDFLEQNEQGGKLSLMSVGGWAESLYITINSLKEFDQSSTTVQRIADQKITFGNLYSYLRRNEDKSGVKEELKALQPIRGVFASLEEKRVGRSEETKSDGKMVLGGKTKIHMNEDQFNALKLAVNEYRNRITLN